MAISFIRIDDRIIHGQTVTRWANEYPCTGLIGVNDAAAGNKLLVSAFKGASSKKTFVWNKEHFKKNADKVLTSKDQYFLMDDLMYSFQQQFHQYQAKMPDRRKFQIV